MPQALLGDLGVDAFAQHLRSVAMAQSMERDTWNVGDGDQFVESSRKRMRASRQPVVPGAYKSLIIPTHTETQAPFGNSPPVLPQVTG